MIFDRQQLETFSVVVEMRNVGFAAKALSVTRGAVSRRIIALKEALGTPLPVRDGSVPTPAGEAVLRYIQVLKLMEADNRKDALHSVFLERLLGFPLSGYAAYYFPSPVALLTAVRAGVGYGLVPSIQVQPLLGSGELIALAPNDNLFVSLYWHHWEKAPPHAQTISELVMRQVR